MPKTVAETWKVDAHSLWLTHRDLEVRWAFCQSAAGFLDWNAPIRALENYFFSTSFWLFNFLLQVVSPDTDVYQGHTTWFFDSSCNCSLLIFSSLSQYVWMVMLEYISEESLTDACIHYSLLVTLFSEVTRVWKISKQQYRIFGRALRSA